MKQISELRGAKLFGLILVLAIAIAVAMPPGGVDFKLFFYPAGQMAVNGQSPYLVEGFYNPIWTVLPFMALSFLPLELAWRVWIAISILGYSLVLYRLNFSANGIILLIFSPFILAATFYGNIDWMVLLGATLPPVIGIWLVIIKPQIGIIVILLWAIRIWKQSNFSSPLE